MGFIKKSLKIILIILLISLMLVFTILGLISISNKDKPKKLISTNKYKEKTVQKITYNEALQLINKKTAIFILTSSTSSEGTKLYNTMLDALQEIDVNRIYVLDIRDARKINDENYDNYQKVLDELEKGGVFLHFNENTTKNVNLPVLVYFYNKVAVKAFANDKDDNTVIRDKSDFEEIKNSLTSGLSIVKNPHNLPKITFK